MSNVKVAVCGSGDKRHNYLTVGEDVLLLHTLPQLDSEGVWNWHVLLPVGGDREGSVKQLIQHKGLLQRYRPADDPVKACKHIAIVPRRTINEQ